MAAGKHNLIVEQGVDQEIEFVWTDDNEAPINLTGYTIKMQIRETAADKKVWFEASTALGNIVVVPAEGKLTVIMSSTATSKIGIERGVYDIELTDTMGKVVRLVEGKVTISLEVTR